jgi:hypothetical protein
MQNKGKAFKSSIYWNKIFKISCTIFCAERHSLQVLQKTGTHTLTPSQQQVCITIRLMNTTDTLVDVQPLIILHPEFQNVYACPVITSACALTLLLTGQQQGSGTYPWLPRGGTYADNTCRKTLFTSYCPSPQSTPHVRIEALFTDNDVLLFVKHNRYPSQKLAH